jgi:hypothetical protein
MKLFPVPWPGTRESACSDSGRCRNLQPMTGEPDRPSNSRKRKEKPRSRRGTRLSFGARKRANLGVCTLCTLLPSDWAVLGSDRAVLVPDWAGLAMFSGEWRIFKGRNSVRVPPRAQCFRRSEAF